ncbi:UNVERIFIED_CONTAM: Serine/threonine-protein phosphatase 7 long form [Sesamum angustifolium]|uniref:Serine/threonine-protein phosphatase 7 long form n=1 Tax=Sesamum angustifolium TaxID=2727405 RepID=A0AAW2MS77_9LAMI
MDRRAVYGPRDGTVLSQQSQHRSDEILDGDIDEVLQAKRADSKFWKNLREQDLPIRVQQILHQIGFYGVYRCGRIQYDCHLITALVERWRSETHSFHFRVEEATITLQDVQYIGFAPEEGALKGSRLQVKAIIHHISRVHITPNTPHLTVVQYARAVALLLLGGTMCPDSSGNLVSLLYLAKLEDIVAARNYSWGSAVLAFLYRELCNASEKGKAVIGGALQLVQIWAWSRIIPLCLGLGAPRVHMGPHQIDNNRVLPRAPYGAMWNWDFNPQLWRSICPLIFYAIVEMHHPERVLRQFGMMQNIPDQPDTRDMSLHKITRSNRMGTDWVLQHILYITRWQRRYDTVIERQPISNRRDTDRGYWEWITMCLNRHKMIGFRSHAEAYSSQVDLDLGLGINQPYAPEYNISPVPFPSFSAYRDNVESSSAASSSGLHCILIPVVMIMMDKMSQYKIWAKK